MPRRAARRIAASSIDRTSVAPGTTDAALAPVIESLRAHVVRTGLNRGERQQVVARLPTGLVQQAKKRTGLESNTDLLTVALANLVVEDAFADAFEHAHGQLDPELDIGF